MSALKIAAYVRKSLVSLVGGLIGWASISLPDGHVSFPEWISLAVLVATALGVYVAPNSPL